MFPKLIRVISSTKILIIGLFVTAGIATLAISPIGYDKFLLPSAPLTLTNEHDKYSLISYLEILEDQEYSFQQVSSPEFTAKFKPTTDFDFTLENSGYWIRLDLTNQSSPSKSWLIHYDSYRINQISAYIPDQKNGDAYREVHTGNTFPFSSRDYEYQNYIFQLDLPLNSSQTIYFYLSDVGGVSLEPLEILSLSSFSQEGMQRQFWTGAFYFSILLIAAYTAFFYFSLNDRNLLIFFLLLIATSLMLISNDGLGHQYLWPNSVRWAKASTSITVLLYLTTIIYYSLVSLNTRIHFPRLANFTYILLGINLIILFIRLNPSVNSIFFNILFVISLVIGLIFPIFLAIHSRKVEKDKANFFLLAFTAYLAIFIVSILGNISGFTFQSQTLTRWSFLWMLLIFSISTNLHINRIRQAQIVSQKNILAEQQASLQLQIQLAETLRISRDNIIEAYDTTLEGWAHLLELRDKETEGHSRNVVNLSIRFAKHIGIPNEELVDIRRGALLHDIGKIAITDNILLKPKPLTDDEWEIMRQHPVFALKFLSNIPFLEKSIPIPAYHHENWDGTGYSHQLAGESIPLHARLFSVIDNWDALRSDRPYRKAWSEEKTIKYIRSQSGKKFDPNIVESFLGFISGL